MKPRLLRPVLTQVLRPHRHILRSPRYFSSPAPEAPAADSTQAPTPQTTPPAPPPPPPPSTYLKSAWVNLTPTRRLIEVSGLDARNFLQGLTTISLNPSGTTFSPGAFLSAPGRILFDIYIYTPPPISHILGGPYTYLIEHAASLTPQLLSHLRRYKLRSKADIRLLDPSELSIFHSWGHPRSEGHGVTTPKQSHDFMLTDSRIKGLGCRHVIKDGKKPLVDCEEAGMEEYRLHRYMHGLAEGLELTPNRALPHESNLDLMGAVAWDKGCYVGQELTIRTQHTGVVRKRILPVMFYNPGAETVPKELVYKPEEDAKFAAVAGEEDVVLSSGKGRPVGRLLGRVGNIGLCLARLDVMTDVALEAWPAGEEWAEGKEKAVESLPEFVVKGAESVAVKALVPKWMGYRKKGEKPKLNAKTQEGLDWEEEIGEERRLGDHGAYTPRELS